MYARNLIYCYRGGRGQWLQPTQADSCSRLPTHARHRVCRSMAGSDQVHGLQQHNFALGQSIGLPSSTWFCLPTDFLSAHYPPVPCSRRTGGLLFCLKKNRPNQETERLTKYTCQTAANDPMSQVWVEDMVVEKTPWLVGVVGAVLQADR